MFMASDIQVSQRAAVIYAANKSVSEARPAAEATEMCGYNAGGDRPEITDHRSPVSCCSCFSESLCLD